jgi:hypothetical protein
MPSTLKSSTSVDPIGVTLPQASELSGLSKHKLREEINAKRLDARKHGSSTIIIFQSLKELVEGLPRYQPGVATPEATEMVETRKRLAARQRARREAMIAAAE